MYTHMILYVGAPYEDVFTLIAFIPNVEGDVVTFEVIATAELFPTNVAVVTGILTNNRVSIHKGLHYILSVLQFCFHI